MAQPTILTNGLQAFYCADQHSGSSGANVSQWDDLSGNARHLTCGANYPTIISGINSRKAINFNNTRNPLQWASPVSFTCAFVVARVVAFDDYDGLLTGLTNEPILVGNGNGATTFFDYKANDPTTKRYEFRVGNQIQAAGVYPAISGSDTRIWFVRNWSRKFSVDGIQVGKDRNQNRLLNGYVYAIALYDRDMEENEIWKIQRNLAKFVGIPVAKSFPYAATRFDQSAIGKRVLTDNLNDPTVRVKRTARELTQCTYSVRTQKELEAAKAFYDTNNPAGRFILRDYRVNPPKDTVVRYVPDGTFDWTALGPGIHNYAFSVEQTALAVDTETPAVDETF